MASHSGQSSWESSQLSSSVWRDHCHEGWSQSWYSSERMWYGHHEHYVYENDYQYEYKYKPEEPEPPKPPSCLRKGPWPRRPWLEVWFSERNLEEKILIEEDESFTKSRESVPFSYVEVPPGRAIYVNVYRKEVLLYLKANKAKFMEYEGLIDEVAEMKYDYQMEEHHRRLFQNPWQSVKRLVLEWDSNARVHREVVRVWNRPDPAFCQ